MNRKWIPVLMGVALIMLLTACGGESQPSKPEETPKQQTQADEKKTVVEADENEIADQMFVLTKPVKETVVNGPFEVNGTTSIERDEFFYTFEDGHNQLAKGSVKLETAADAKPRAFTFQLQFEQPTSPYGTLTLYDASAADAVPQHSASVTVKFSPELLADVD